MHLSEDFEYPLMFWPRLVLGLLTVLVPLSGADIEFLTEELPWAVLHKGYAPPPLETRSSGTCPLGGISYAVVSGELPPGIQFSRLGYFKGVPSKTGAFEIAVRVSNGCTWTARHFVLRVTEAPILAASPGELEFDSNSPQSQIVRLGATWPRLAYQIASDQEWLTATPATGFMPDELRVSVNPKNLKPGRYVGHITVSAWQSAEALRLSVVLFVRG